MRETLARTYDSSSVGGHRVKSAPTHLSCHITLEGLTITNRDMGPASEEERRVSSAGGTSRASDPFPGRRLVFRSMVQLVIVSTIPHTRIPSQPRE